MDIQSKFEGEKQKQQPLNPPVYWDLCRYLWHLVCIFYSSIRIKPTTSKDLQNCFVQKLTYVIFCIIVWKGNKIVKYRKVFTCRYHLQSYYQIQLVRIIWYILISLGHISYPLSNFRKSLSVVTMRLNVWCFPSWLKMVLCVLNSRWSIGFATSKSLNAQTWFQMSASSIKIENTQS